ncbi:MAG TPA: hypothetical protein VHH36_06265 [Candidatus Thermoplasmatota archaeon]|nr:hypothetical protein [Candidatus Thermoplasmatota archaeon]
MLSRPAAAAALVALALVPVSPPAAADHGIHAVYTGGGSTPDGRGVNWAVDAQYVAGRGADQMWQVSIQIEKGDGTDFYYHQHVTCPLLPGSIEGGFASGDPNLGACLSVCVKNEELANCPGEFVVAGTGLWYPCCDHLKTEVYMAIPTALRVDGEWVEDDSVAVIH